MSYQYLPMDFDLEKYQSWRSESRGLLWIKGKPGAGNAVVARLILVKTCSFMFADRRFIMCEAVLNIDSYIENLDLCSY